MAMPHKLIRDSRNDFVLNRKNYRTQSKIDEEFTYNANIFNMFKLTAKIKKEKNIDIDNNKTKDNKKMCLQCLNVYALCGAYIFDCIIHVLFFGV